MVVSTSGLPSGAALATAKKIAAAKAAAVKKPRAKPSHPSTADMVESAIKTLKERGGSSLQAIKKYIAATYKVDAEKLSPFIKKYLKSAVASKDLVQVKGKGASGSFKLSVGGEGALKSSSSPKAKRPAAKKSVAKKPISPVKKAVAAKPKKSLVKSLKKTTSPKKAIKTVAAKSPKPKVRKSPKKPSKPVAKKTASKAKKTSVKRSSVKK